MACGLSIGDSLLPQVLHFADFEAHEMRRLSSLVQEDVKAASRELLEACVLHTGRLWFGQRAAPQSVSQCTRLVSSGVANKNQEVLEFRMMDRHPTAYLLTIPDAGEILDALFLPLARMAVAVSWCG